MICYTVDNGSTNCSLIHQYVTIFGMCDMKYFLKSLKLSSEHLDLPNTLGYKRNTEIKHINIMQDKAWRSYITLFLNCSLRNLFCHITNSKTKSYCLHLDSRQILWFREMRACWCCQIRKMYNVYRYTLLCVVNLSWKR